MKTYYITYTLNDGTKREMAFDAEDERSARLMAWNATTDVDGRITQVTTTTNDVVSDLLDDPVAADAIRTLQNSGHSIETIMKAWANCVRQR